jgi:hypothetical protein
MASKSTIRIETEMYNALEALLDKMIQGNFYPGSTVQRPDTATTEDAVLTVSSAETGQIEEGIARLNIYVPDIDCGMPTKVGNTGRLDELAAADEEVVDTLNGADTDYLFELKQATQVLSVPDKSEHFVNITLRFRLVTFND